MESDDSYSEQVEDLSFDSGANAKLGLRNSSRPRARKMDGGDKKSGPKKRSKMIEISSDSGDDEPIGFLFKLKRPRNLKKVKAGTEEGGGEKGQKEKGRQEKLGVENEGFAGMNDTLASFRKKLKGPKKDVGSGNLSRRGSGIDGFVQANGDLDVKSTSVAIDNGLDKKNHCSELLVDRGLENKRKGKVKGPKIISSSKTVQGFEDDSDCVGSLGGSLEDHKGEATQPDEGSSHSLDEQLEDPLSSLFEKAQSGLIKRCRANSSLKLISKAQTRDNGFSSYSESVLGVPKSVAARRLRSAHASSLPCQNPKADYSSPLDCGLNTLESAAVSAAVQRKSVVNQKFDDSLCQAETVVDPVRSNIQEGPSMNSRSSNEDCDEYGKLHICVQVENCCFDASQKTRSHTEAFKEKVNFPCMSNTSSMEQINSVTALGQMEENQGFVMGEPSTGCSDALDQQSKDVLASNISRAKHEISPSLVQKEISFSLSGDVLLKKSCKVIPSKAAEEATSNSCSSNSSLRHAKFDEAAKVENLVNSDYSLRDSHQTQYHPSSSPLDSPKVKASDYAIKVTAVRSSRNLSVEEVDQTSPPSINPEENDSYAEDVMSVPDFENKDVNISVSQRVARNAKKRRHGDMAYEGDVDWEVLISDQGKAREKLSTSSDIILEAENGGAAAVSAGLKARAAGSIEKIKFKDILKRRGGLQEYLECRNQILGLWSKDVSRILPLAECGVTDTPLEDEPARASLIREIYSFLDQSGYINVGIASIKEKAEPKPITMGLLKVNNTGESPAASFAESEEGVSFILGRVKNSESPMDAKNTIGFYDENQTTELAKEREPVTSTKQELQNMTSCEECSVAEHRSNGTINSLPERLVDVDVLGADPSSKMDDNIAVPVINPEPNDLHGIQPASDHHMGKKHPLECDSKDGKRIIVIGAGPAGLTAGRHLKRQGFAVTVLEARGRVGGRVYTDHSSLSVPVDLGASIITGVEADVATERRPDPSSLICSQLGLELTVLNSDCPLYDVVTGRKVPADLDEALEAEFNSLLDDMVLLVARKGELAIRMSLEDGFEYALKRRRMARLGKANEEIGKHNSVRSLSVDGMVIEKNQCNKEILSPLERRIMDWHFANLEYGCAALLKDVSLPYWNQDDVYGGFGGAHCMIKGGYSTVIESLGEGLRINLNHVVTEVSYGSNDSGVDNIQSKKVKVSTSDGTEFSGDAVLITVPLGCLKAESIKFSPPLPQWKHCSIQRLGFGVLNKIVLEFPEVFWDDSVDYFGATSKDTDQRGQCFMFWNVRKTVGAPVLIALVVGKAAVDGQNLRSSDHVSHALMILRELFREAIVPDPVASVVTDWGRDPFSYGAYSYVAIGASGEDYDILGRPVENCLFFAGEATCKEHPDTVGGAMMSGLREAVRIIDILSTGNDYTAEVEAMEAAQIQSNYESDEVRDIENRLDAVEFSNVLYKNSLDRALILTKEALLQDMFFNAKTTAGRLYLAKELLNLPVETLKSFAGTKDGLTMLNSWILDSMGKDGTQLLRHCVRILVRVSTDLLAVRSSGIGKTVKEKVCVHTSRDIRAIASQLVSVWLEVFRKEKASSGGLKLPRQVSTLDSSRRKSLKDPASGKPPLRAHGHLEHKSSVQVPASAGSHFPSFASSKKSNGKMVKVETVNDIRSEINSSRSLGSTEGLDTIVEEVNNLAMSEEEQAAVAAAEAARAAALAAAKAYETSEAKCNTLQQLPKIPSFHKFARREQYAQMDESDFRKKWPGGVWGKQDCISEIDSRNCRVRDWSVDFSAACMNLHSSRMSVDNFSQQSHSTEIACHLNLGEQSGENVAVDSNIFTEAWVDAAGSVGIKDYHAIERWQSQAAAADSDFYNASMHVKDEEGSNTSSRPLTWKHEGLGNDSAVSQVTVNKEPLKNHPRGADRIKHAVVDYVASLLMPLYKARKIDREGYKSIMKKSATKVMEQATDAEKTMAVSEFLDFKRRNKIRSFVDKLIERHMVP